MLRAQAQRLGITVATKQVQPKAATSADASLAPAVRALVPSYAPPAPRGRPRLRGVATLSWTCLVARLHPSDGSFGPAAPRPIVPLVQQPNHKMNQNSMRALLLPARFRGYRSHRFGKMLLPLAFGRTHMNNRTSPRILGRNVQRLSLVLGLLGAGAGCSSGTDSATHSDSTQTETDAATGLCTNDPATLTRPSWWTTETHCPGTSAGYDEVFSGGVVRRLDFAIPAADFASAESNLKDIVNSAKGDLDGIENPMWMPATLTYNSKTWTQVGVRWKGHASLKGAYLNGVRKLSMKVKFDAFEDSHPELLNQRFYGFSGFGLANGYKDPSLIRDKTAADIFRAAGVPAPRESFAAVYVDIGKGPFYMGLYTIIEEPENRMLSDQIGDDSGNLYKPWGDAARWRSLSEIGESEIETYFEKANNETTTDWSDVVAAIKALHADRTDAATWRANLERVFDVQSFLKVIAVNQTIVNWDSYGCMHHNYLVYANPLNDKRLTWLPWDLNESMEMTKTVGCVPPDSIMLDEIVSGTDSSLDTDWPLIKFILGDEKYRADYKTHLKTVLDTAFTADKLVAQMRADHDLVAAYVTGPTATESGLTADGPFSETGTYRNTMPANFQASLTTGTNALEPHVASRRAAVQAVLSE
jgi:spore coat protein H